MFAGVNIPELNRSVSTPTSECAPIRTKTHTPDSIGVAGEGISVFGGSDIPEANRFVATATSERAPIRAETHAIYPFSVSGEDFFGVFQCQHSRDELNCPNPQLNCPNPH